MSRFRNKIAGLACAGLLLACSEAGTTSGTTQTAPPGSGGSGVSQQGDEPEVVQVERQRVLSLLEEVEGIDAAGLAARYPTAFEAAPVYEQQSLLGLSTIQASTLALNDDELSALEGRGFVLSDLVGDQREQARVGELLQILVRIHAVGWHAAGEVDGLAQLEAQIFAADEHEGHALGAVTEAQLRRGVMRGIVHTELVDARDRMVGVGMLPEQRRDARGSLV